MAKQRKVKRHWFWVYYREGRADKSVSVYTVDAMTALKLVIEAHPTSNVTGVAKTAFPPSIQEIIK
jgi:hypothetical protein